MIKEKIYIFGASNLGKIVNDMLQYHFDIVGFIDNSSNKWGKEFCDKKIYSPKILDNSTEKVIIASSWGDEIEDQLDKINYFNIDRIYSKEYCELYVKKLSKSYKEAMQKKVEKLGNKRRVLLIYSGKNSVFVETCARYISSIGNLELLVTQRKDEKDYNCNYVRVNINNILELYEFLNSTDKFDLINIHYIESEYSILINSFKEKSDKLIVSIYGADFHNARRIGIEKQKEIYSKSDKILFCNPSMANEFLDRYGNEYNKLISIIRFGLPALDILDKIESKNIMDVKKVYNIPNDKIIINIGHSADKEDNHLEIIEQLNKFMLKKNIFCILPLTYGGDSEYKEKIKMKLIESKIEFLLLDKFLEEDEITELKLAIDIHVNLLNSDNFSGWMQECLYAGSIVIYGEWLKYDILSKNNMISIKTINEINNALEYCINNITKLKALKYENKSRIRNTSSNEVCVKKWVELITQCIK
ncbi:hypothetical protein [Clostridium sp. YIM B02555]|uniref:nucleoside-diphosphate sugar epimerase/dehydratase n=1 Tax=Clostridium sp. YIM B02555 TaxID=2911968 RepID=UPI001EEE91C7|nr:hypothetical protein [Clostridium sp. YIM B02555]